MSAMIEAVVVAAAAMLLGTTSAQAQSPMPAHYAWSDGYNSTKLWLNKRGHSAAIISYKTCVGQLVGRTQRIGRSVVVKDNSCVLNITFDKTYTRAYVKESNCFDLHGANCTFDGTLTRQ